MEAPEKIYIPTILAANTVRYKEEGSIEYVRADAFIEKACKYIRGGGTRGDAYIVTEFGEEVFNFVQLAEDFKNYMKGE